MATYPRNPCLWEDDQSGRALGPNPDAYSGTELEKALAKSKRSCISLRSMKQLDLGGLPIKPPRGTERGWASLIGILDVELSDSECWGL